MTKLLIDECLSAELALMARERGHHDASHVVWIGKSGWKDWELKEFLLHEDWSPGTARTSVGRRTCRAREECSQMFRFMPALSASMGQLGWTSNFSGFFFSLSSKNLITNRTLRIKFWKSRSTSRVRE